MSAPGALDGWTLSHSGKVRDLYRSDAHPGRVLLVATDRVSAFDHILEPEIPGKGELLTRLSRWWFDQLSDVPNHLAEHPAAPDAVARHAMVVHELDMLPVECVVRGYLTGSGWAEYRTHQTVCGIPLPGGLTDGARLPEPLFTPAWKAPQGQHDENITFDRVVELVGAAHAENLRDLSLQIYRRAAAIAEQRGLILADTKFEFGLDSAGVVTLADEVLTSDSSRYWDAAAWERGQLDSFDKQLVRNWLLEHWDARGTDAPPRLADEVVAHTAARYRELIERLTGYSSS